MNLLPELYTKEAKIIKCSFQYRFDKHEITKCLPTFTYIQCLISRLEGTLECLKGLFIHIWGTHPNNNK